MKLKATLEQNIEQVPQLFERIKMGYAAFPEYQLATTLTVEIGEKTSVLRLERKEEIPEPESIKKIYHHSFQIVLA